jgi:hypothetical protein
MIIALFPGINKTFMFLLWQDKLFPRIHKLVKIQNRDGKVKSSSSRGREFRGMRHTNVRRSEHEMKRNAEIGLFTKPSGLAFPLDRTTQTPKSNAGYQYYRNHRRNKRAQI